MSGICGFTGQINDRDNTIKNMTDTIAHRGPDHESYFKDDNIYMGYRRLNTTNTDFDENAIYNDNKNLVINFNGTIYNADKVKEELTNAGYKFNTNSHCEIVVKGFEHWQEDLLNKLRGVFAFVIYNNEDNSLFLARDHFGSKPLHYTTIGNDFIYGSEIKSILKHPNFKKEFNEKALDNYLSFQYAVPPETFFKNVYALMPAHYLWYKDNEIFTCRYWEPVFNPDENITEEEAVKTIEKVFEDSVENHKKAGVEVGCFLSSGVDSSYVSTYFTGQKAFTVGFDFGKKYNEISWAESLSEKIGLDHHTKLISSEEFWSAVPDVQYYTDQPLADPSCIALYFVSKLTSQHVKVVLSGEGADELFGGYTCYNDPRVFKLYQTIVPYPIRKAVSKLMKKLPDIKGRDYLIRATHPLEERFIGNAFMFDKEEKEDLLAKPSLATRPQDVAKKYYRRARKYDDVTKMQYLDINLWMVGDILLKADRTTMANSLEVRSPFLDTEVFKVASKLPTNLRVNKYNTKYALRKAALNHLPEATAEKEKLGFPVPTRVWLRDKEYYNKVYDMFTSETCYKFFNHNILLSLLEEHYENKEDNSRKIWTVYVFLVWYNIYFGEDDNVELPNSTIFNTNNSKSNNHTKLGLDTLNKNQDESIKKELDDLDDAENIKYSDILNSVTFEDNKDNYTETLESVTINKETDSTNDKTLSLEEINFTNNNSLNKTETGFNESKKTLKANKTSDKINNKKGSSNINKSELSDSKFNNKTEKINSNNEPEHLDAKDLLLQVEEMENENIE